MRLRTTSRLLFGTLLAAVLINLALVVFIQQAQRASESAMARRDSALHEVDELVQGTDLLAALVQNYTTTGRTRYLDIYYDILGVWQGETAAPDRSDASRYWREALAGRHLDAAPQARKGVERSLVDRLAALDFTAAELAATRQVLAALAPLQAIEMKAFAATQGLLDRSTGEFIDEAVPDPAWARELVHAPEYEARRAELLDTVGRLQSAVRQRTDAEVGGARGRLQASVVAAVLVNLLLAVLAVAALTIVRRRVLRPVESLVSTGAHYAAGRFDWRGRADPRQASELAALEATLTTMAEAISADLRQRDEAQAELAAARDAAEAAARAKTAFLANMSHEIRTPMNAIMGMTQLALRSDLAPAQRQMLDKTLAASQHLLQLINDILDFSKIEAGGMTLSEAPFEIEGTIAGAMALVRQRAQEKGLELLCEIEDASLVSTRACLHGDSLRLGQVLTNLLANAVKFTEAGCVTLKLCSEDGADTPRGHCALVIRVSDTGIGMTERQQSQLFREFKQGDESITRRFGGTGLGLVISQRLVGAMGGRIEVTSQPGAGSTFSVHVTLPVERAAATDQVAGRTARVLVVDDVEPTRITLASLLHRLGIGSSGAVAVAASAAAMFEQLAAAAQAGAPFDTLLLDWVLPDMDGHEVLARLRAHWPALRVAVMTAHEMPELGSDEAGIALALIDKPLLPHHLRSLFEVRPASAAAAAAASRGTVAAAGSLRLDGLRLLLVEDNALNREVAQGLLAAQGARVSTAHDGLQGLERLHAEAPDTYDVVLLDLQMPVLDGEGMMKRLRAEPRFAALPVIAMTANAMPGERERCLGLGMQDYVSKPFEPATLYRAVLAQVSAQRRAAATPEAMEGEHDALPALDGVDNSLLLRHCGGRVSLARLLLRRFADEHDAGLASWAVPLRNADMATLARAAHTLQGQLGTLGATALRGHACLVESAAGRGDAAGVRQALPALEAGLTRLVAAIDTRRHLLADLGSTSAFNTLQALPGTAAERPVIEDLRALLADSDSRALEWWQQHQDALAGTLPPQVLRRLRRALAQFDFDAALAALDLAGRDAPTDLEETR